MPQACELTHARVPPCPLCARCKITRYLLGNVKQVARKKEASKKVKELREHISVHGNDASDLEAQQQHLLRQTATLKDRIRKLESQVGATGSFHRQDSVGCQVPVCWLSLSLPTPVHFSTSVHYRLHSRRRRSPPRLRSTSFQSI